MATSKRSSTQGRSAGAGSRSQASRSERSGSRSSSLRKTDESVSRSMGGQTRSGGRQNEGMYGADYGSQGQWDRQNAGSERSESERTSKSSTRGQGQRSFAVADKADREGWDDRGNLSSNAKRDYQDNRSYGYSDHDDREEDRRFSPRGQSERYDMDAEDEHDRYSVRKQSRALDREDDDEYVSAEDRRGGRLASNFRDDDEDGFQTYNPEERSERSPSRKGRKASQSRSSSSQR